MKELLERLREEIAKVATEANYAKAIGAHGTAARLRASCAELREIVEGVYARFPEISA
jgi:hypothetical protein